MHVTEQALLPPAESMPGHRYGDRHVDTHHADLDAAAEFTGDISIAGITRDAVAELVGVDEIDRCGKVLHPDTHQHGAEDLFFVDPHLRRDMIDQRATEPEAVLVTLNAERPAGPGVEATVDDEPGTARNTIIDVAVDLLQRLAGDDRAHLGVTFHAVLDLQLPGALREPRHDPVGHIAYQHRDGNCHATLAGRAICGADECVDGLIQRGVGHHD